MDLRQGSEHQEDSVQFLAKLLILNSLLCGIMILQQKRHYQVHPPQTECRAGDTKLRN